PRRAEGIELVLADDVRREAVRVGPRVALGVGEQVDLAMRLLERLGDLQLLEPPTPGDDLVDLAADGVPGGDLRRLAVRDSPAPGVGGLPVEEEGRRAVDAPDQPAYDGADQRVVEIPLAPLGDRPGLPLQEHRVDAVALGRQHRLDVLERLLQLLELVLVVALDLRRDRLERLAAAVDPPKSAARPADDQAGTIPAERLGPPADFLQTVRRHAHLLDLVPRQPERLGRRVERLLDLLLGRPELDADL